MSDFSYDHYYDLLETAFENNNYDEAYRYSTKIIENDPSAPPRIWAYRGLSAGHLSTPEKPRILEMLGYLRRADALNSGNDLNTEFIGIRTSHIVNEFFLRLTEQYSSYQDYYSQVNRPRTVYVPQNRDLASELGAGCAHGLFTGFSERSSRKTAARELGAAFRSNYQEMILQGMEYAWSVDKSNITAENIFIFFDNFIGATGLDAETKRGFVDQSAKNLLSGMTEKYPDRALRQIPGDGFCFIATAVLGDSEHPYVLTLRHYRDQSLQHHWLGRRFIRLYYRFSPPVAMKISQHKRLRLALLHVLIRPAVWYARYRLRKSTQVRSAVSDDTALGHH